MTTSLTRPGLENRQSSSWRRRATGLMLVLLLSLSLGSRLLGSSTSPAGLSADAALQKLKEGNGRYVAGTAARPHQDVARRAELASGQQPFATVLACADSRVPPELIFDQGLGDLFIIRAAGNPAGRDETATIEYGAEHLGSRLLVVLGHLSCGAVKAAVDNAQAPGDLGGLIQAIRPAAERARQANPQLAGSALLAAAVEANVWLQIETLFQRSEALRTLTSKGQVRVVGAVYDLSSGQVKWLGQHPEEKGLVLSHSGVAGRP